VIELPRAGKVAVAELESVAPGWAPGSEYRELASIDSQLAQQLDGAFVNAWFDYDSMVARLNYQSGLPSAPRKNAPDQPLPDQRPF
jgi:hypothetical protein